ncbi:MAG: hypothetical protein C0609_02580, partial [Deltaproteobacteria bacterium]
MKPIGVKVPPLPTAILSGLLAAFAMGAARTMTSTEKLLEKNLALKAAGFTPLPGNGHWEVMESLKPALSGGLFFALAMGAGFGVFGFLVGRLASLLGHKAKIFLMAASTLPPIAALLGGETLLGATLAVVLLYSFRTASKAPPPEPARALALLISLLILASPLAVILSSTTGGFETVRNALVKSDTARGLSDFYYRWTLYPAESIKPLLARTQVTAFISPDLDERRANVIGAAFKKRNIYIVGDGDGADMIVKPSDETALLATKHFSVKLDTLSEAKIASGINSLSSISDDSKVLRRVTLYSLAVGFPLALFLSFAAFILWSMRGRRVPALILCAIVSVALGLFFRTPSDELAYLHSKAGAGELAEALSSPDPLYRLYGALGGMRYAEELSRELIAATADPVINVRYTSALALEDADTPEATERLREIIASKDDWYVKSRAFYALKS